MADKYNILKLIIGTLNIGYILNVGTHSYYMYNGDWWKYVLACVIMLLILLKWISFAHGNENLWAFVITLFATVPINIRITFGIGEFFAYDTNIVTAILYSISAFMCLVSVEEVLVGTIVRMIWSKQNNDENLK